jgi:dihydrofolate synthase/folylpolyglutamate synthase
MGAPLLAYGQHWHVAEEHGRMIFQDDHGLLDLPLPNLLGGHQVHNAGSALAALRHLNMGDAACTAAVTDAYWPARMQRLRSGPLTDAAPQAELWLDGGHNPAAALALVETLSRLPRRPTHLIVGMLNTKDIAGFLRPLGAMADTLHGVTIPGQTATLTGAETVAIARAEGIIAETAPSVMDAVKTITTDDPMARVVICGSLYLAGTILQDNG